MAQYIQKFENGGNASESQKNKLKFKTASREIDAEDLARNYENYLREYAKSQNLTGQDYEDFLQAAAEIQSGIKDGTLSRGDGLIYSGVGLVNGNKYQQYALQALDNIIDAAPTAESKEKSAEKFNINGIHDFWKNKFFGGADGNLQDWRDRDILNADGSRDNINRRTAYAQMINEYADSLTGKNYNFEGSAHKDMADYINKLRNAAKILSDENWDQNDVDVLNQIGVNKTFRDQLFGNEDATEDELSEYEQSLKEKQKKWKDAGLDQATIDYYSELDRKQHQQELLSPYAKMRYDAQLEEFGKTHWTKRGHDVLATLGSQDWNEVKDVWNGHHGKDEGDDIPSWIEQGDHKAYADALFKKAINGKPIDMNLLKDGLSNGIILRGLMYTLKQSSPELFTNIDSDSYYINSTFDLNSGTAVKYNTKTKQFIRMYVDPTKTKILKEKLKKMYNETYGTADTINNTLWAKHGAKLNDLRLGGITFKAQYGAKAAQFLRAKNDAQYNKEIREESIDKFGDDSKESVNRTKLGHAKRFSTEKDHKEQGLGDIDNSDYIRLGTLAADLASIPLSYAPVIGNAAAGLLGIGSTIGDLIADITDDSVTAGQTWANLGTNAGLTALSLVPSGGTGKIAKVIRSAKAAVPLIVTAVAGTSLANDPEFQSALKKLTSDKKLTTNDFKSLAMGLKILAGGHNALKTTAGKVAPKLTNYKGTGKSIINPIGEGAGRWGYNAFGSKGIYAKDTAAWNAVKEAGGLHKVPFNVQKKGEKYVIKTENGTEELNAKEFEAMQNAYNKAIKNKKSQTDVLKEVTDAFKKARDLKSTKQTKSSGVLNLGDEAAVKAFFATTPTPEADGTFKVNIKDADGLTSRNIDKETYDAFKAAYESGSDHNAGISALNTAYKNKFADITEDVEPQLPIFDLGDFKTYENNSNWNPLSWLRFRSHDLNAEDQGSSHWIKPQGDLFGETAEGQKNLELLVKLNDIYKDQNNLLANNFEYINGLSGIFKNLSLLQKAQIRANERNNQIAAELRKTENESLAKQFDAEIAREYNNYSGGELRGNSWTKNQKVSIQKFKNLAEKSGVRIDNEENFVKFLNALKAGNPNYQQMIQNPRFMFLSKQQYKFKHGGQLNLLQELRKQNFTIDDSQSSSELSEFKNGGIIKAQQGWKARLGEQATTMYYNPDELLYDINENSTQRHNVTPGQNRRFNKQNRVDAVLKHLTNKTMDYKDVNEMQARHYGLWRSSDQNTGFNHRVLINDRVKDYQERFQNYGFNDSVILPDWEGNYAFTDKPYTADKPRTWNYDGNYGQITDDRRILARRGDYAKDDGTDEEYLKHKKQFADAGYDYYLDEPTGYYMLQLLNPDDNKDKDNDQKKPDDENTPRQTGGMQAGIGTGIGRVDIEKSKKLVDEFSNWANKLLDPENTANLLSLQRYIRNLRNNNRVLKQSELAYKPVLKEPMIGNKYVYTGFDELMQGEQGNRNAIQSVGKAKTSDAIQNGALNLQAINNGQQIKANYNSEANKIGRASKEAEWDFDNKLYQYNNGIWNFNNAALVEGSNMLAKLRAGKLSADQQNFNTLSMEAEQRLRTRNADRKNAQLAFDEKMLQKEYEDLFENDPKLLSLYKQYSQISDTDYEKLNDLSEKISERRKEIKRENEDEYYSRYAYMYNLRRNGNFFNKSYKHDIAPKPVWLIKKGSKIDDSKMKYRDKDHDRLVKQVIAGITHHQKALDNLSKGQLLSIKKALES